MEIEIRPFESDTGTVHAIRYGQDQSPMTLFSFCGQELGDRNSMPDYESFDTDEVCGSCVKSFR